MNDPLSHTLTIQDVMEWLGVSRQTVYDWVNYWGMPYRRIGKKKRFKKEEIQEWLDRK